MAKSQGKKQLVATAHILCGFTHYRPGDILPSDSDAASVWLEAGTAVLMDEGKAAPPSIKARRAAAEPGLPGHSVGGEEPGGLVGKVPATPERRRSKRKD